jgi:mycothiol synthase
VEPALGEIFVIAVDPDFGGRGLGRALTEAGFDWLHRERGIDTGMLYVDAGNHAGVGLYTKLGMTRHHIDRAFLGNVPAANSTQ